MMFTRDLRLADNPALAAAARAAAVVPLFVLDEAILRRAAGHPNRLGFLLDSLHDLDAGLRGAGVSTPPAHTSAVICPNSPGSRPRSSTTRTSPPGGHAGTRRPIVDHRQAIAAHRARRR